MITPEQVDALAVEKVFSMRNGSCELFFDDVGLLQQIVFRKKKRKEADKELKLFNVQSGRAIVDFDKESTLAHIMYETTWRRPKT